MVLSAFSSSPSAELVAKAEEIHRVLSAPSIDVWKLRELALTEGGLVDGACLARLSLLQEVSGILFLLVVSLHPLRLLTF